MELTGHRCSRCGAELTQQSDTRWRCRYCGCTYDDATAAEHTKKMRELFDEVKLDLVNNLRRNLYDATTAEYISSVDVKQACVELKKYLPDDFSANFYEIAAGNNVKRLTAAIRGIDVEAHRDEVDTILDFLIKSLQPEFLLELNNLAERAYKSRDLKKFERVMTDISVQAEKVQMGVYETKLPREVFVAYSSRDMEKVSELVEELESQGLKCFVAARNLRHGKGAVENYDRALKEAMDHCKSFVFVSTPNSRSFGCDALKIELPYIQEKDTQNAPAEYRNDYAAIPHRYKKPRVEYRVEDSQRPNAADIIVREFFDGYEWVLSPAEVALRVLRQIVRTGRGESAPATEPPAAQETAKKYCINCGTEVRQNQNFCPQCGKNQFVDDQNEYLLIKQQREAEQRRKEEEQRRKEEEQSRKEEEARQKAKEQEEKKRARAEEARADGQPQKRKKAGILIASVIVLALIGGAVTTVVLSGGLDVGKELPEGSPQTSTSEPSPTQTSEAETGAPETTTADTGVYETLAPFVPETPTDGFAIDRSNNHAYGITGLGTANDPELVIPGVYGGVPVTSIHASAFQSQKSLTSVTVSEGVTQIGENAFYMCTGLTRIALADSVHTIEGGAFFNCTALTDVRLSGNLKSIESELFSGCTNLRSITLPQGLEKIGEKSFYRAGLTSINIPNSVKTIEWGAFQRCTGLTSVHIPNSVTAIGVYAFSDCSKLTEITIPDSVTTIEGWTFSGCSALESVTIPSSIQLLGEASFSGCSKLTDITYEGTMAQWLVVDKFNDWNDNTGAYTVHCTDGEIAK